MESEKERQRATTESRPPRQPDPAFYEQKDSMLLRLLPQELRLKIYAHLFSSKRLQWGVRKGNKALYPRTTPRQTLALVRTCRRVRDEIGDSWVGQIHFTFKTPEALLNVLTALPVATLSKLRHVRVTTENLMTEPLPGGAGVGFYYLDGMFKLLPGLRLDTLTVQDTAAMFMQASYAILDEYISKSCGWKELYYISCESRLLGFPIMKVIRHPQPAHWQRAMDARDGFETKLSVTIYRSTLCDVPGSVLDPNTRVVFEQDMSGDWIDGLPPGTEEDEALTKEGESGKEMMVAFKRGFGVDYEEKEGSPFVERDIRRNAPGLTWQEIRRINMEAGLPHGDSSMHSRYKWESEEDD
ncbi:hypothetical protein NCS56_01001800 [Fusarium sp. Ph1]|nr:hypothetical protein NCS56_01001800 [Fusarium sp. Ph1]